MIKIIIVSLIFSSSLLSGMDKMSDRDRDLLLLHFQHLLETVDRIGEEKENGMTTAMEIALQNTKTTPSPVSLCVKLLYPQFSEQTSLNEDLSKAAREIDAYLPSLKIMLAPKIVKPSLLFTINSGRYKFSPMWSPDGSKYFTGLNGLCIHDAVNGAVLKTPEESKNILYSYGWSPRGSYIYAQTEDKESMLQSSFTVWDSNTGKLLYKLSGQKCPESKFTSDEKFILQKGLDVPVTQFDAKSGSFIRTVGDASWLNKLKKRDKLARFIVASTQKNDGLFDINTGELLHSLPGICKGFSPDGLIALVNSPETALIHGYHIPTGKLVFSLSSHCHPHYVTLNSHNTHIIAGDFDTEFRTELSTGNAQLYKHKGHHSPNNVYLSLDQTKTIAFKYDGEQDITTIIIKTIDGNPLHETTLQGEINDLQYSYNPEYVVCGSTTAETLKALIHMSSGSVFPLDKKYSVSTFQKKPHSRFSTDGKFYLDDKNEIGIWQLPPTFSSSDGFGHILSCSILANNRAAKQPFGREWFDYIHTTTNESSKKYIEQLLKSEKKINT